MEKQIKMLYEKFWNENEINPETGIWKKAPNGKELRFASMPFIGSHYHTSKIKVLFVGADIGRDEAKLDLGCDTIIDFEQRRCGFENDSFYCCKNLHVPGTFIATLVAMKELYPESYLLLEQNKGCENRTAIKKLSDKLPLELMKDIALTNFYKFVKVGREKRKGNQDRQYFGIKKSIAQLFKDEIITLNPDVVWFQGSVNDISHCMIKEAEKEIGKTIKIIRTYHPSAYRYGANMVKYYVDLKM